MAGDKCVRKIATLIHVSCSCYLQSLVKNLTWTRKNLFAWLPFMDAYGGGYYGCHLPGMFKSKTQKIHPTVYYWGKLGAVTKFPSPHALCAQVPQLILCVFVWLMSWTYSPLVFCQFSKCYVESYFQLKSGPHPVGLSWLLRMFLLWETTSSTQ